MAVINGTVVGAEAGFYPKEIEQSLRFNDDDSAYLSWTPASAGNRKTWTWSGWVKRGNLGVSQVLFGSYDGASSFNQIGFATDDTLQFALGTPRRRTNAVYRDVSAWYHIVCTYDSTNATGDDRMIMWVNGERITSFKEDTDPSLNADSSRINNNLAQGLGAYSNGFLYFDGYLAETHFTDGTAYDATAFGEFKNGVWIPKTPSVTYGTNGFYLPFRNDYTVEGFSTVTYRGTEIDNTYIGGVGFEPDLVWIKRRNAAADHSLSDSVRGTGKYLVTNNTSAELTGSEKVNSFDTDGFTISTGWGVNQAGYDYVAWCWDAGTGSPVSNTDGSITSTVKANPARGFSVVSYTGPNSASGTFGHGLDSAPEIVIIKNRGDVQDWHVFGGSLFDRMQLNNTGADDGNYPCTFSSSTVTLPNLNDPAWSGSYNYIAYCFHSVSGYSKMGSYTGTGASGNTVTTGFKPAFVMIKCTDSSAYGSWRIFDGVRFDDTLYPNLSDAEYNGHEVTFTDTGFTVDATYSGINASGNNHIYMAFADTREAAFWLDDSGNNNDWENNGLTESDISLDSPTNNFATLNPLDSLNGTTYFVLSEGNLRRTYSPSGSDLPAWSTFSLSSGKWYFETACITNGYLGDRFRVGVTNGKTFDSVGNNANSYGYAYDGNKYNNSSGSAYGSTYTEGDIIGTALDLDAGTLTFYKNGVSQGTAFTGLSGEFFFGMAEFQSSVMVANFGQDSSFAGNKVPQGYTDANGRGDFYYAPPAGYLALCTANLPEPAIGPNSASTSDEHFNTVLWTGDSSSSRDITVGFQPDFTWVKNRSSGAYWHGLYDSVRGADYALFSNATNAEDFQTGSGYVDAFISDGVTLAAGSVNAFNVNGSGNSYVGWNWKANGSGVSNTDGSITSTVSANVDAGFSTVSWTSNQTTTTIGHGLNQAPAMIITKNRSSATNWPSWYVYHQSLGNSTRIQLNETSAATSGSSQWGNTDPTSSVFTAFSGASGDEWIAYCFAEKEGFSKFGSYTGNGSTDGTYVHCGFRPAFVMIKNASTSGTYWHIVDTARETYNVTDSLLFPNDSLAETTNSAYNTDLLSNGFKVRNTNNTHNTSGNTYIYMAFAELPAKYSPAK